MHKTPNVQNKMTGFHEKIGKIQNFQIVEASASCENPIPQSDFDYTMEKVSSAKQRSKKAEEKKIISSQGLTEETEDINN